jgi:hypothetical protein
MALDFYVDIRFNGLKLAMSKPYANRGMFIGEIRLTKKNKKQTDEIRC